MRNRIDLTAPTQAGHREMFGACELQPHLPVLEAMHAALGGVDRTSGGLFGLQHLFGSTASLIHRIIRDRIAPDNVFLLGKPYSTNHRVLAHLARRGYRVHPDSTRQPLRQDNDSAMDRRIASMLDAIRGRFAADPRLEGRRMLLIDDGGRAIRLLHTRRYADIRRRFTCVEQTRCGARSVREITLEIPVINVAESWVKLEHESPLIAESVTEELGKQLGILCASGLPVGGRALVIGYGAIGKAVGDELRRLGYRVEVFDSDPCKRADARQDGLRVHAGLHEALAGGGIVVGCTGLPTLGPVDYDHIPDGTILISASSADVEFRAWNLRSAGRCLGRPQDWALATVAEGEAHDPRRGHPCFSLFRVENRQGRFFLVNGGFPVNFDGGVDTIAPAKIQLTRALLYVGAWQASLTREPGLHDLDGSVQQRLLDTYLGRDRAAAA
jgi:S-adenosylhomocysteine hydrolase